MLAKTAITRCCESIATRKVDVVSVTTGIELISLKLDSFKRHYIA